MVRLLISNAPPTRPSSYQKNLSCDCIGLNTVLGHKDKKKDDGWNALRISNATAARGLFSPSLYRRSDEDLKFGASHPSNDVSLFFFSRSQLLGY